MIKVSVIIPCYNAEKYMAQCLDSVTSQSLREIEIICVDDGSTDASVELLQCFKEADSRIRILTQNHGGAGAARNLGMTAAEGKYLLFLDSDDAICDGYLQNLYDAAEENNAQVTVTLRVPWDGSDDFLAPKKSALQKELLKKPVFSRKDFPDAIFCIADGAATGKLFEREFVRTKELQFPHFFRSEDFFFVRTAFALADRMHFMEKSGYLYRKNNPTSLENTKDETPLIFWEANLLLKENLKRLGCLEALRQSYLNDAVQRYVYNMNAVKGYDGFCTLFRHLKETVAAELELEDHEPEYFAYCNYQWLLDAYHAEKPDEFVFRQYRTKLLEVEKLRGKVRKLEMQPKPQPKPQQKPVVQTTWTKRLGSAVARIAGKGKKALRIVLRRCRRFL